MKWLGRGILAVCIGVFSVLPIAARMGAVASATPGEGAQRGSTAATMGIHPEARRIFLQNGLEVLLLPNATSRLVTSIVVVRAGSNREDPRLCGASHFLEHMLFNGTARRTQKQLYDEQDAAGGFNNAFTRRTHAAYMMTLPADLLDLALDLQSDMLFNSLISLGKFEKERGIILEELEKDRERDSYQLQRILQAETYPQSGYGLPVLGTEHSIRSLQRAEVWAHYKRFYVPENMVAVLLGGFDPETARDALDRTLGAQRPAGYWPEPPPPPAPIRKMRIIHHRPAISRSCVRVIWNAPAPEDPGFRAAQAAADLQLGGSSSPLGSALQERFPGAILSCHGSISAGPGFGRLIIDVAATAGSPLDDIRQAIQQLVPELRPPDVSRIEAWKVARRAEQIFAHQRSYMFAPLYSEELALLGAWGLETQLEHIGALSSSEVRSACSNLGSGPSWAILIAAAPSLQKKEAAQQQEMEPPAQQHITPYAINDTTLSNGAHLLLINAPADGSIAIYVLIEGRNYLEPPGKEGITELLHNLMSAGAGALDEAQLQEALEGIGADIQTADMAFIPFDDHYTGRDFSFIRFQALEEFAQESFHLLGQILRKPRLEPDLVERERSRLLARLQRDEASGRHRAGARLWNLVLGAEHPESRSAFGTPASVAGITVEDLRDYHKRLLDPRRVWIGVVSSAPLAAVSRWTEGLLPKPKGLPSPTLQMSPEGYELWRSRGDLGTVVAEHWAQLLSDPGRFGLESSTMSGGKTAQPESAVTLISRLPGGGGRRGYVLEALLLPKRISASPAVGDAAQYTTAAQRVATGVLSSRLAFHLREEKGMAYGIGASLKRTGDRWLYLAGAGTRKENLDAMAEGLVRVRREAREAADAGAAGEQADSKEMARAASRQYGRTLRRQEVRLNQAMYSVWAARNGRDPRSWWQEAEELRLVPTQAVAAALQAISGADPSVVIVAE